MENEVLKNFLKITCRPKVKLMENGNELLFIDFNGIPDIEVYKEKLQSKYDNANDEIVFNRKSIEPEVQDFMGRFEYHLEKNLLKFYNSGEYVLFRTIKIRTLNNKRLDFADLPDDIKKKISLFINLNRKFITDFLSEIRMSKDVEQQPKYKCKLSKRQLVVLSSSLFNCDLIESESGKVSRDQFVTDFGRYLGTELKEPRKILNNITNAEELSQIFDMLKEGYLRSYSDY